MKCGTIHLTHNMLFFQKIHKGLFSAVLTALFVLSWLACSVHIPFTPEIAHADSAPSTHQSSQDHSEGSVSNCIDHTPTQVVNRDKNEPHNILALVSNPTAILIDSIKDQTTFVSRIFTPEDDPFNERYSFLIDSKLII